MKGIQLLSICFFWCIGSPVNAQHCPFDGSYVVVIKVVDKKGNPVKKCPVKFELVELENPKADSCTYAKGLLNKIFAQSSAVIFNAYTGSWEARAKKFSNCSLFGEGCYAVLLNQAENQCMLKNGGDFSYEKRKFMIRYVLPKSKKEKIITTTQAHIYSLCTTGGSWCRIMPIKIVL
jgi:hypothetical protein